MSSIIPVVLCGGSGTRLWPLSREGYPKQFVDLGDGRTLFKDTIQRVSAIENCAEPIIVCNEKHRFYALSGLKECGKNGSLILEPAARNTAPAIALAALKILDEIKNAPDNEPLMLVLPSDHSLQGNREFAAAIKTAIPLAEKDFIVTFGIPPTNPATGFGYIARGEKIGEDIYSVLRFVEKPNPEAARAMLDKGGYYWNSGIFLLKPSLYLRELANNRPDISRQVELAWNSGTFDKNLVFPNADAIQACPEESIDYAIMEKTSKAVMAPLTARWNDMGSWESFFQVTPRDKDNNACMGDVILENAHDCFVQSNDRLVAAIGISDLAVVETKDAVLVTRRDEAQRVKNIVGRLKKSDRPQYMNHPLVYRPWGSYETIAKGERFQVKRIIVEPGETLSLQLHHHRAEHWIVVRGTAEITNGDKATLFTENQSTYIPVGCKHRLRNPGVIPLELIEIQSGPYLGEDDIVRFEDIYGRKK